MRRFCMIYSGLNLNQDKAMKPQTVQIVRQGEATPYWFKFNSLYYLPPLFFEYCGTKVRGLHDIVRRFRYI